MFTIQSTIDTLPSCLLKIFCHVYYNKHCCCVCMFVLLLCFSFIALLKLIINTINNYCHYILYQFQCYVYNYTVWI